MLLVNGWHQYKFEKSVLNVSTVFIVNGVKIYKTAAKILIVVQSIQSQKPYTNVLGYTEISMSVNVLNE